jgi:hypothetical protein
MLAPKPVTFRRKMTTAICFSILALLAPLSSLISSEKPSTYASKSVQQSLQEILFVKISEVIAHSKEIPGLTEAEFSSLRDSIQNAWHVLSEEGVVKVTGADKEVRPCFVALQGVIEHVLSLELQAHAGTLNGFNSYPYAGYSFVHKRRNFTRIGGLYHRNRSETSSNG